MNPKPPSNVSPMPPKTREIFSLVYRFRQKFLRPCNKPEWWERCTQEAEALCKYFDNDAFCVDLIATCIADIEREMKGERIP